MGKLVVEVDGHDFHDRTKEQASYDRKRDRELSLEGYRVIRFTGSDVYNFPDQCTEDIDYHVNDLADTLLRAYTGRGNIDELISG
jgi:very-short-patch-repair endonuclease